MELLILMTIILWTTALVTVLAIPSHLPTLRGNLNLMYRTIFRRPAAIPSRVAVKASPISELRNLNRR